MNYNKINTCECTNGLGGGVSLFTQGCPIRCEGCFNPETGNFKDGKEFTEKTQKTIIKLLEPKYIVRFSILGGEPLIPNNIQELLLLCKEIRIKYPLINIGLGTGYTWEQLQERLKKAKKQGPKFEEDYYLQGLFDLIDYLVVGPFIQEEKDLTLKWRGSCNQKIIDLSKERN